MGDYDGRTALHLASAEGHLRCVRFLLDVCKVHIETFMFVMEIKIRLRDNEIKCLCSTYKHNNFQVKHDCKDRWGQTPLTEAIQFKHTKVAAILKRYDRTRQMKERKGKLPLVRIVILNYMI